MNEINRKVAIALGYTIKLLEDYDHTHGDDYHIAFIAPDGSAVHAAWYGSPDNIERVIDHMYALRKLPDWGGDLNAAMPLLLELPDSAIRHSTLTNMTFVEWFSKVNGSYEVLVVASDTSIAETICQAWLLWKGASDE